MPFLILFIAEANMYTILIGGLCAFVVESADDTKGARTLNFDYPAVAIGAVVRDQCRASLVLADGKSTPFLLIQGALHSFRVEKINETSAIIWIDDGQSFAIPRTNVF
jgi:hypothetical protein